jgi:hypothetical protein
MAEGDSVFKGMASWAIPLSVQCVVANHAGGQDKALIIVIQDASGPMNYMMKRTDAGQFASEIFFKLAASGDENAEKIVAFMQNLFGNNKRDPDGSP